MNSFYELLANRVLVLDGAMGTMIQQYNLSEKDFRGEKEFPAKPITEVRYAGCNDLLCLTRPDIVTAIHTAYLKAGADIISTDTFNANAISLADYELNDDRELIRRINRAGASLARAAAEGAPVRGWGGRALVAGSMGPTNKAATMSPDVEDPACRNVTYDQLYDAYFDQSAGLIEGGADILLFETVFDTLNLKAGLDAANAAMEQIEKRLPVMVSVTVSDRSGRTLSGQTLKAFVTSVGEFPNVASFGINCSFGPKDIVPYVKALGEYTSRFISTHPNAGLPDAMGCYDVTPEKFAVEIAPLLEGRMVNIIGGCCGTTPRHIEALRRVVDEKGVARIPPCPEQALRISGLESFEVKPENNFLVVGERCNVAGSRKFLRLIKEKKYEEAIQIAVRQVESGASVIDINMDDPLIDAAEEMTRFLRLYASEPEAAKVPVMVDSSEWKVIESALKNLQGKSIVNSISLKEGEEIFIRKAIRIRQLGAAVIVMAFDEKGQADTYARKIEICRRAYDLLVDKCGYNPEDIIFDVNIMAVATGLEEHSRYGIDFIEAVRWIKKNLPGARTSGGVSNLSFAFRGKNALREAMHTVFLYHAIGAGLDMAIMNPSSELTYEAVPARLRELIEDVVLARRPEAADQLSEYAAGDGAVGNSKSEAEARDLSVPVARRVETAIITGKSDYLAVDLDELSKTMGAVEIVEGPLMEGMRHVGDLFGEGKMFLPQVVKTARVMKMAVDHLEPLLRIQSEDTDAKRAGKILIATVKGDVHDIGKNIVAIVLSCNNFEVIDLGVMVSAEAIVEAARKERPDIVCLSGLITPSLAEMTATAEALGAAGFDMPLLVGGATTSALHTALKIAPAYGGPVMHMRDASQNPIAAAKLLDDVSKNDFIRNLKEQQAKLRMQYDNGAEQYVSLEEARKRGMSRQEEFHAVAPLCGAGKLIVRNFSIEEIEPFVNWKMFLHAWGMHGSGCACGCDKDLQSERLLEEARECLKEIAEGGRYDGFGLVRILPAHSSEDNIVIGERVFPMLRQQKKDTKYASLSDFVAMENDYAGVFMAGAGKYLDEERRRLEREGDSFRALLIQSLADRLAEATSEYLHFLVRTHYWGYASGEKMDIERILKGDYVGIRPAMGYPMLPDQLLNREIVDLLNPESEKRVVLTENGAMAPSSTVSGIYISHPQSRYFMAGAIGTDQIEDYASRRNLSAARIKEILNL